MIPYDSLLYFYILGAALLVGAIIGLCGKSVRPYGMLASIAMLLIIFDTGEKRLYLAAFFVFELFTVLTYRRVRERSAKAVWAWVFIILAVAPLAVSKLSGTLFGFTFGFLGISYLTFRSVQVIIETYDGVLRDFSILDFSYFMLFFPTISSGPVDRYRRFSEDVRRVIPREEYIEMLKKGVYTLMTGVMYSLVIAALINNLWLSKIGEGALNTWQYMYAYTLYLFFNFAGYSRMAIGTGYILGVKVPVNFNMPFVSRDLKDFWSRWHISLSTWFRDYIYSRFVAVSLRGKWFKNVYLGSYIGYIITMTVMGFWHGFEPRYIIYGAYHGVLMCVNDILDNKWKKFKKIKRNDKYWPLLAFITFNIISFGMLIFSGRII